MVLPSPEIIIAGATLVLTFAVVPIYKVVRKIQTNELAHIAEGQGRIERAVEKIGDKLDSHIAWHMDKDAQ